MPSRSQATTTQTTTATGRGTCLAKSSSGSTGSKMNPTIINRKSDDDDDMIMMMMIMMMVMQIGTPTIIKIIFPVASPSCQTTTISDPTTSIGTTSHVMILPDSFV